MIIKTEEVFTPVSIKLETPEEVQMLFQICGLDQTIVQRFIDGKLLHSDKIEDFLETIYINLEVLV